MKAKQLAELVAWAEFNTTTLARKVQEAAIYAMQAEEEQTALVQKIESNRGDTNINIMEQQVKLVGEKVKQTAETAAKLSEDATAARHKLEELKRMEHNLYQAIGVGEDRLEHEGDGIERRCGQQLLSLDHEAFDVTRPAIDELLGVRSSTRSLFK